MSINQGRRLYHSSIRIGGEKTVYIDPWQIKGEPHDADLILVTHDHGDHYSLEDIARISRPDTVLVVPESMASVAPEGAQMVKPGQSYEFCGVGVETVAAYNIGRSFHTPEKKYVGYIVTLNSVRYYIAGDTDKIPENERVRCDVAFVPCGGKYTMDAVQASALVNVIRPRIAVPTHFGTVTDSADAGKRFAELVMEGICVELQDH